MCFKKRNTLFENKISLYTNVSMYVHCFVIVTLQTLTNDNKIYTSFLDCVNRWVTYKQTFLQINVSARHLEAVIFIIGINEIKKMVIYSKVHKISFGILFKYIYL